MSASAKKGPSTSAGASKTVVKTVGPKIPTAASASAHKAGGGNVEIFNKVRGQTGGEEGRSEWGGGGPAASARQWA